MTHICVGKLIIIGSDNGLSPDRRQAIIWTNTGLLSIRPLRTCFSENLIKMQQFSLKKMHMKMSSTKWRLSCLGINLLIYDPKHYKDNKSQSLNTPNIPVGNISTMQWCSLGQRVQSRILYIRRAVSGFAPSQWEASFQSDAFSQWLGVNRESARIRIYMSKRYGWMDRTNEWNDNNDPNETDLNFFV